MRSYTTPLDCKRQIDLINLEIGLTTLSPWLSRHQRRAVEIAEIADRLRAETHRLLDGLDRSL